MLGEGIRQRAASARPMITVAIEPDFPVSLGSALEGLQLYLRVLASSVECRPAG